MLLSLVSPGIQVSTGRGENAAVGFFANSRHSSLLEGPVTPDKYTKYTKEGTGDTAGLGLTEFTCLTVGPSWPQVTTPATWPLPIGRQVWPSPMQYGLPLGVFQHSWLPG